MDLTLHAAPTTASETHHCVTGSMWRLYQAYDHPVSEEMLFGLGEGAGYIYWHQKGQLPFIGGRANPRPSVEEVAAQRTGVALLPHTTGSARKAETSLLTLLEAGTPVMLQVDMGFLPYFDFGGEAYHFGGHVILACEFDASTDIVLVADRDAELHPVSLADLAQARGSTHKPFPPKNRWWTADFSRKRPPQPEEIHTAIANQSALMLRPPIRNIGVSGIRKTAQMVPRWAGTLTTDELRWTLFNAYIFISPVGGTGGGAFRYMFSRFLAEAAEITGDATLAAAAAEFQTIGDRWEAVGDWFRIVSESGSPADRLSEVAGPLLVIADLEELAWARLDDSPAAA